MVNADPQSILPFPLFLLFFAFMWISISILLSFLGGWRLLGEHYRSESPFTGKLYHFSSATLRFGINYGSCLMLGASADNLSIAIYKPWRIGHPSLLIPLSDISARRTKIAFIFPAVLLEFRKCPNVTCRISERLFNKLSTHTNGRLSADGSSA